MVDIDYLNSHTDILNGKRGYFSAALCTRHHRSEMVYFYDRATNRQFLWLRCVLCLTEQSEILHALGWDQP